MKYPIAPNGIYWSIQGEGALLGVPMNFVRLAGCSIGCPECDTDYSVAERLSVAEIVERLQRLPRTDWTWITGGEPTDHEIAPLVGALKLEGYVALATAGVSKAPLGRPNFVSVSPHGKPQDLVLSSGSQLNLVVGLNGLSLYDWRDFHTERFGHCFVTPCDGKPETLEACLGWVRANPKWRLNIQAHKTWRLK